jgi:hypothetical protein
MEFHIDACDMQTARTSSHVDRKRLEHGYIRTDEIYEVRLELQVRLP